MILVQLLKLLGFVCISTKWGQLLQTVILKVWQCMLFEVWQCMLGTQPAVLHTDTCSVNLGFYFNVCPLPRRRQWQPTPVLLPWKSHGWRSLVGYSPWGREKSDTIERLTHTYTLKKNCQELTLPKHPCRALDKEEWNCSPSQWGVCPELYSF